MVKADLKITFEASENTIGPDETVTFTWEIDGAETIYIDNDIGDVSDIEEIDVTIEETTIFTISATDSNGLTQSESITIKVVDGGALVDIDITKLDTGPLSTIINEGSLVGDFEAELDVPNVETVDGVNAVTLDGFGDWYVGPDSTPLSGSADRSIEVRYGMRRYQLKKLLLLGDEEADQMHQIFSSGALW